MVGRGLDRLTADAVLRAILIGQKCESLFSFCSVLLSPPLERESVIGYRYPEYFKSNECGDTVVGGLLSCKQHRLEYPVPPICPLSRIFFSLWHKNDLNG